MSEFRAQQLILQCHLGNVVPTLVRAQAHCEEAACPLHSSSERVRRVCPHSLFSTISVRSCVGQRIIEELLFFFTEASEPLAPQCSVLLKITKKWSVQPWSDSKKGYPTAS